MQYEKILRLALLPTILFFILSLASVALTTHYWILGDWIVPRGVRIVTDNYNQRTQTYTVDDTIVFFIDKETDATITSGCLCLIAAIKSDLHFYPSSVHVLNNVPRVNAASGCSP
jgi:hypothetical protein